jgi:hypothetical protein
VPAPLSDDQFEAKLEDQRAVRAAELLAASGL